MLQGRHFTDLPACQEAFDRWRTVYNMERPHQALELPISRYAPSPRRFPETSCTGTQTWYGRWELRGG